MELELQYLVSRKILRLCRKMFLVSQLPNISKSLDVLIGGHENVKKYPFTRTALKILLLNIFSHSYC